LVLTVSGKKGGKELSEKGARPKVWETRLEEKRIYVEKLENAI